MGNEVARKSSVVQRVSLGSHTQQHDSWHVATETAVEIDINGVPLTVMMATPDALENLAVGLAFTEGVVLDPAGIEAITVDEFVDGVVVNLRVAPTAVNEQARRSRLLEGRAGCGLCGVETLAAAMRRPVIQQSTQAPQTVTDVALRSVFDRLRLEFFVGVTLFHVTNFVLLDVKFLFLPIVFVPFFDVSQPFRRRWGTEYREKSPART